MIVDIENRFKDARDEMQIFKNSGIKGRNADFNRHLVQIAQELRLLSVNVDVETRNAVV